MIDECTERDGVVTKRQDIRRTWVHHLLNGVRVAQFEPDHGFGDIGMLAAPTGSNSGQPA